MRLWIWLAMIAIVPTVYATELEDAQSKRKVFILAMIAQLGHEDVAMRDEAERTLYHLPVSDKRHLVAARNRTEDKEAQRRLDRLIAAFPPALDMQSINTRIDKLYMAYLEEVKRVEKLYQSYGSILNNVEPPNRLEYLLWAATKHIQSSPARSLSAIKEIPVYELKLRRAPLPQEVSPDTYFEAVMERIYESWMGRDQMHERSEAFRARSNLSLIIENEKPPSAEDWQAIRKSFQHYLKYDQARHKRGELPDRLETTYLRFDIKDATISEVFKFISERTGAKFYWEEDEELNVLLKEKVSLRLHPPLALKALDAATKLAGIRYEITADPIRGEFIRITAEEEKEE